MTKSKVNVKDKKNGISIEIINKLENNQQSKNRYDKPEAEEAIDTEENTPQPEYSRPTIINNQVPYDSTLTRQNYNNERTYQPTININNDALKRSFIEQTLPEYVGGGILNDEEEPIEPENEEENEEELESVSSMDSVFKSQKTQQILLKSILNKAGFKLTAKLTNFGSIRLKKLYETLSTKTTISEIRSTMKQFIEKWKTELPNLFD